MAWWPRPLMSSQRSTRRPGSNFSVLGAARSHMTVHASTDVHAPYCAILEALSRRCLEGSGSTASWLRTASSASDATSCENDYPGVARRQVSAGAESKGEVFGGKICHPSGGVAVGIDARGRLEVLGVLGNIVQDVVKNESVELYNLCAADHVHVRQGRNAPGRSSPSSAPRIWVLDLEDLRD